jgi:hypothetical protein
MKKVLLFIILAASFSTTFAQYSIFMEILENKKICNKDDQLTYFLQSNSFERRNEEHYYHNYAVGGAFYTTCIINQNECYVIYQTNNAKDYEQIKAKITSTCAKEYAKDKSVSYICSKGRVQDVQIMFTGYSQAEKIYEILVYQDPEHHELPYSQADRKSPEDDRAQAVKKQVKKKAHRTTVAAKAPAEKSGASAPAPKPAPAPVKPAPPTVRKGKPSVTTTKTTVPSVMK